MCASSRYALAVITLTSITGNPTLKKMMKYSSLEFSMRKIL